MQNLLSLWLNTGAQITHGGQVQRPRQNMVMVQSCFPGSLNYWICWEAQIHSLTRKFGCGTIILSRLAKLLDGIPWFKLFLEISDCAPIQDGWPTGATTTELTNPQCGLTMFCLVSVNLLRWKFRKAHAYNYHFYYNQHGEHYDTKYLQSR